MVVIAEVPVGHSLESRMSHLGGANANRSSTARVRVRLREAGRNGGKTLAAYILLHEPELVASQRICEFLLMIPAFGERKVEAMFKHDLGWQVWPLRRVRDLTDRQREMIVDCLIKVSSPTLSPAQWQLLNGMDTLTSDWNRWLLPIDIAEELVCDVRSVSGSLPSLRKMGLVASEPCGGGASHWSITDQGRVVLRAEHYPLEEAA